MGFTLQNPVTTKRDFTIRYANGEFGNASPTWMSLEEWLSDEPLQLHIEIAGRLSPRLYHIRNRITLGPTYYNVGGWEVAPLWMNLISSDTRWRTIQGKKCNPKDLYISEMCPTHLTLFQGEVFQNHTGLDLRYTTVAQPMRQALNTQQHHIRGGLLAVGLLKKYLCCNSYGWLQHLLDTYPGHVIEFTTLSTNWGTVPGYNTIFWEVRNY